MSAYLVKVGYIGRQSGATRATLVVNGDITMDAMKKVERWVEERSDKPILTMSALRIPEGEVHVVSIG